MLLVIYDFHFYEDNTFVEWSKNSFYELFELFISCEIPIFHRSMIWIHLSFQKQTLSRNNNKELGRIYRLIVSASSK